MVNQAKINRLCIWLSAVFILLIGQISPAQTISETRHIFLKKESLEEAQFLPERMRNIFELLMRDILAEDPEIVADLVLHTHRLVEKNRLANSEGHFEDSQPNGNRTHIASFLQYYERAHESIDTIGVHVRTYREDHKGLIQYRGYTTSARKYAFLSHFLSCGGNYNTSQALDQFLTELRRACGEGNSLFLIPDFLELCYSLRHSQRDQLTQWARENSKSSEITIASISRAALIGLSIFETAEHIPHNPLGISQEDLDKYLIEILRDETISPSWRIGFSCIIAQKLPAQISQPLRIEIGRTINLVLSKNIPVENFTLIHAMSAFLGDHSDSEQWMSMARKIITSSKQLTRSKVSQFYQFSTYERHWISQKLALVCRAGTQDQISEEYLKHEKEASFYPNRWIELIRADQFELANQLFTLHGHSVSFQSSRFILDNTFDNRLNNQVARYISTITNKEDRCLAELLLVATPNNKNIPESSLSTPQQRLNQVVQKYKDGLPEDFSKEKHIRVFEVLTLCRDNPTCTQWLEQDQKSLIGRLLQRDPKVNNYWGARMEMHSAVEQLTRGIEFPALMTWGRIAEGSNKTIDSRRRYLTEAFLDLINEQLEAAISTNNQQKLAIMSPFCRKVLNSYPDERAIHVSATTLHRFMERSLIAHASCDQIDQWNEFWKNLFPQKKTHLTQLLQSQKNLVLTTKSILNPDRLQPRKWQPNAEKRRQMFSDLFLCEWVDQGYVDASVLAECNARNLLTKEDTIEIAEQIARKAPRTGSAWREYLGIMADSGQSEDALHELDDQLAIDHTSASLLFVLKMEKLLLLKAMNKTTEANSFEAANLLEAPPELPREYRAIVRKLERR